MSVYVFKLTNGDDVIGSVEGSVLPNEEFYNIVDPMTIVGARDEAGLMGMRLRATLLLGSEDVLTIAGKHVITYYKPIPQLAEYYQRATEYATKFTRPLIHEQIELAIREINRDLKEEEEIQEEAESIGDIVSRIVKTTLH